MRPPVEEHRSLARRTPLAHLKTSRQHGIYRSQPQPIRRTFESVPGSLGNKDRLRTLLALSHPLREPGQGVLPGHSLSTMRMSCPPRLGTPWQQSTSMEQLCERDDISTDESKQGTPQSPLAGSAHRRRITFQSQLGAGPDGRIKSSKHEQQSRGKSSTDRHHAYQT